MAISSFLTETELQNLLQDQFENNQGVAGLLPSATSPFFRMDATGGVVPKLALEPLYPNFGAPMIEDEYYSPKTPLLESGIPTIQNLGLPYEQIQEILKSSSPQDDLEASATPVAEEELKQSEGIMGLLKMLNPFKFFDNLKSLNQRIQQTDFAQSDNMMDYLEKRRRRKETDFLGSDDDQGNITTYDPAKVRNRQRIMNIKPTAQDKARGQITSRKTSAPKRSISSTYEDAKKAFRS